MTETITTVKPSGKADSVLKTRFISHGTLACKDIDRTRRFYEEFLGLEVVRTSPISLMVRRGGQHVYACVQIKGEKDVMPRHYHNGLDVRTKSEVDEAHRLVSEAAETWGITRITRPVAQHGTYSFMFWDLDDNCWEILSNPEGGYTWIFEQGDQEGRGHLDRSFPRPGME
jgi:catechol 2,3-dioxygenase-like lactoylglutathione lyase family enzyme